jgi:hypothetical protein
MREYLNKQANRRRQDLAHDFTVGAMFALCLGGLIL